LRRTGVEDLIRRRHGGEDGDTKLTDLLAKLADCPKARSASIPTDARRLSGRENSPYPPKRPSGTAVVSAI
jgi:hypothetical protein